MIAIFTNMPRLQITCRHLTYLKSMRGIYVQLLLVLFYLDFFLNKRSDDASSNKSLINKRMQEQFSWPPAAMNEDKRRLKDVANTMRELERPRQRPLKVLLHQLCTGKACVVVTEQHSGMNILCPGARQREEDCVSRGLL